MAQRHVAIYGPLPAQFQRVLAKLPKQWKDGCRFSCLGNDKRKRRVATADLHVVWTKFMQHAAQSTILDAGGNMRLIPQFNADTLVEALEKGFGCKADPAPKARQKRRKKKSRHK